jgi:hypothetical protein
VNARGHIDEVRFVDPLARNENVDGSRRVPQGSSVYVRGWAFVDDPPRAAEAAVATIDDGEPFELAYNQMRRDVVEALKLPAMLPIGFHGVRSLAGLALGPHEMRIALVDRTAGASATIDASVTFNIVDGALAFPATQRLGRGEMIVAVDAFTTLPNSAAMDAQEVPVVRGSGLTIRGWAVDRRHSTAASDVYACIDGTKLVRGIIGTMRADVAGSLEMQTVARCGYAVRIDTSDLASGDHRIEIRAVAADGERYASSEPLAFVVTSNA